LSLAIFDLDNTLIAGDSDHAWGEFLVEEGIIEGEAHQRANDQFYLDYQAGSLDIMAYLEFALAPLSRFTMLELEELHAKFFQRKIAPIMLPKAAALIAKHRANGDRLLIITATNRFITAPIAKAVGIEELLASDAEIIDNHYTGKPSGTPCFQEGKVKRLNTWLEQNNENLAGSYFIVTQQTICHF
jgi:HAD-superfamily subfamily IB hydrolase, TIGR01490